jgi:hypothetical protein
MGNEAMQEIAAIGMTESNLDGCAAGLLIETAVSTYQGTTSQ